MNIETLADERLESEFPARVKEHYAKPRPQSWRFPRNGGDLKLSAMRLALNLLRRVKNHRAYAVDAEHALEFAAFAIAATRAGRNPAEAMAKLAPMMTVTEKKKIDGRETEKIVHSWVKELPPDDAGTIPALPVDPCTKQIIRNPHLEPKDGRSIPLLKELSPRLNQWLSDCASHGGQPTLAMLDELQAEKIQADYERRIVSQYGEREWEANLLRADSGANLTERSVWERGIQDSTLAAIHRREADLGSPSLKFDNLTIRMAIAKRDPALRAIHAEAHEILKGWQAEATDKAA